VADYLYRETLMSLPEHIQRFLRRTAVLDQLCAPLCDAILEESGGQQRLRVLEALSLFLIPLDRRREWYRYHALFREFLLGELRRVEPEVIMKLQLRAANWYEANGSPALAVEHLLNSTEQDRCVQLVTALILPTYQAGQLSTVQRWLSALGDSAIDDYPPLAVLAGYIAVFTGETAEAQRWAAIVDAASFDQVPADGTASFDSARAMFRAVICAAGPEQMMTDASFAVAQEPPWSVWRDTALCFLAEAHLLTADLDQASALFAESSTLAAAMGNTDSFVDSEAELALLAMDGGRWPEAAGHVELALAAIDEYRMHDYITSVLAFAVAARLAVHRGDLTEADRQLTQAMRARPTCTFVLPWLAVRARLQLAKVYWATGDQSTARTLLREIDDVLLNRSALGALIEEVSEFRRIVTSSTHMGATGGSPLSPAELRLLPYLQTHLTFGEIGERLFISRNTVSTEVASIYRKLNVSPHATTRCSMPRRSVCSAGSRKSLTRLVFQGILDVVPKRQRQLRCCGNSAGQPDDRNDANQHVDDLSGRRARAHCGIGLSSVGGHGTTDGDQCSDPRQLHRFGIERSGVDVGSADFPEACVIDRQTAQLFHVVQGRLPAWEVMLIHSASEQTEMHHADRVNREPRQRRIHRWGNSSDLVPIHSIWGMRPVSIRDWILRRTVLRTTLNEREHHD
jgi:ATP/maltotriose-dependent transcriptional regulator MalT